MLIAVEGLDGCGKSTVVMPELKRLFTNLGHHVSEFHVLKNTRLNNELYKAHVNHSLESSPTAQQFLTAAMFRDSYEKNILPAINVGNMVIMDRWVNSMYVYQHGSLHMNSLIKMATDGRHAAFTIFCDVSYENSVKRVGVRGSPDGRDVYDEAVFNRRRELYIESLEHETTRSRLPAIILDCNQPIEMVHRDIFHIAKRLDRYEYRNDNA